MIIDICFQFDEQVGTFKDRQSRASKELGEYGGNWGALRYPMVRFGSHWPTEPVKGDGHKSVANKRRNPCLQWGGYSHFGKIRMKVCMSNIVKESLDITGKDGIHLVVLPCFLYVSDE